MGFLVLASCLSSVFFTVKLLTLFRDMCIHQPLPADCFVRTVLFERCSVLSKPELFYRCPFSQYERGFSPPFGWKNTKCLMFRHFHTRYREREGIIELRNILGWEERLKFIYSSSSAMSRDFFNLISLLRALSNPILYVCREEGSSTSLDKLF